MCLYGKYYFKKANLSILCYGGVRIQISIQFVKELPLKVHLLNADFTKQFLYFKFVMIWDHLAQICFSLTLIKDLKNKNKTQKQKQTNKSGWKTTKWVTEVLRKNMKMPIKISKSDFIGVVLFAQSTKSQRYFQFTTKKDNKGRKAGLMECHFLLE